MGENTATSAARTLAERLFDRVSSINSVLSAGDCRELYRDMRSFYDRVASVGDAKKALREYSKCGHSVRTNPFLNDTRALVRTGMLIGCVLIREEEGLETAGKPFPPRDNVQMYPEGYKYTVLDMFLSKQFNNDRTARMREGIVDRLQVMYGYHSEISKRVNRQNIGVTEAIRVYNRRVVVFSKDTSFYVLYSNKNSFDQIPMVSKALLIHVMYSVVQGNQSNILNTGIYNVSTLQRMDSPVPIVDAMLHMIEPGNEDQRTQWMEKWKRSVCFYRHGWECPLCSEPRERYYFGNLPFDICTTCVKQKIEELRAYLGCSANIRTDSGRYDFEHLFNTIFES